VEIRISKVICSVLIEQFELRDKLIQAHLQWLVQKFANHPTRQLSGSAASMGTLQVILQHMKYIGLTCRQYFSQFSLNFPKDHIF
jgi:hypothetical protein